MEMMQLVIAAAYPYLAVSWILGFLVGMVGGYLISHAKPKGCQK